jgi:hypothetical protein
MRARLRRTTILLAAAVAVALPASGATGVADAHTCAKVIVIQPTPTTIDPLACHEPPGPPGHECDLTLVFVGSIVVCTDIG